MGSTFLDRYEAFGLRDNPFTSPQHGAPACRAFVDRGLPDPPGAWSGTLVQVVGASGMGKTSQLEHWRSTRPGPFHYIPRAPYRARWETAPTPDGTTGIVYGDEIDRMPRSLRWRWFRQVARTNATMIIGTHTDLTSLGQRAGFAVRTHHLPPFDRTTLEQAIERRLLAASGRVRAPDLFSPADIDAIHAASGGVPETAEVLCHRLLADRVR